jgi:hypothetical protein
MPMPAPRSGLYFTFSVYRAVGRPLQRILRPRHSRIHAQQASARHPRVVNQ